MNQRPRLGPNPATGPRALLTGRPSLWSWLSILKVDTAWPVVSGHNRYGTCGDKKIGPGFPAGKCPEASEHAAKFRDLP
jgi:hypothetical protein